MAFPSIKIQIGADTSRLHRDLKKGEGLVSSFGKVAGNAMLGVAAAAGAAAIKIGVDGVKAAIEDEAAAAKLAKTLQNVTNATASQTKAVEDYISKTTLATGITDDELRPSLDRLVRSTHDVAKAQQLQKLALDVSAGTGKDLQSVTNAIAKAYDGNFGALKKLGVTVDASTLKSKNFAKVQEALQKTFGGQMATSLKTHEGQLRLLNTRWGEMKEEIGYVLLDGLQPLMEWASGPEGQKFLNDFMLAFKDAAVSVAQAFPAILDGIKTIGKAAGAIGFDPKAFLDPRFMAAAGAFKITPGPLQVKALAAIAAYAAADYGMEATDPNSALNNVGPGLIGNQQGIKKAFSTSGRDSSYAAAMKWNAYVTGNGPEVKGYAQLAPSYVTNVTVNGATDPTATAIAVNRALQKATNQKVANLQVGKGW